MMEMMDLYHVNGWLFAEYVETRRGTVYFPTGEPTLSVSANFGSPGDSFASKQEALDYFAATPVAGSHYTPHEVLVDGQWLPLVAAVHHEACEYCRRGVYVGVDHPECETLVPAPASPLRY